MQVKKLEYKLIVINKENGEEVKYLNTMEGVLNYVKTIYQQKGDIKTIYVYRLVEGNYEVVKRFKKIR